MQVRLRKVFFSILWEKWVNFFAITAGSVDSTCSLIGLETSKGVVNRNLNKLSGAGNFYSFGNGVFFIADSTVGLVSVNDFDSTINYNFAVQSGPLLVDKGKINSSFSVNSKNKYLRCAVGISLDSTGRFIHFVVSKGPVSFYQLADFFSTKLKCKQAINLESANFVSAHFPNLKRNYSSTLAICNLYLYPIMIY